MSDYLDGPPKDGFLDPTTLDELEKNEATFEINFEPENGLLLPPVTRCIIQDVEGYFVTKDAWDAVDRELALRRELATGLAKDDINRTAHVVVAMHEYGLRPFGGHYVYPDAELDIFCARCGCSRLVVEKPEGKKR